LLLDPGNIRIQLLVVFAGADFETLFLTAAEQVRHCAYGNNRAGTGLNFLGCPGFFAVQRCDIRLGRAAIDGFIQARWVSEANTSGELNIIPGLRFASSGLRVFTR